MGGGLMQLVAYGSQDIYLTGNPQVTFFKVVYRRHTNFAVESIEQTINGSIGSGSKVSVTVARNGDLLHRVYLELIDSTTPAITGFDAIEYVEVEIGGQVVDKHYGQWMKIWCDLTHPYDKKKMLEGMLDSTDCECGSSGTKHRSYVPLQFWFCRHPGLALPLIALQYHEVKFNIKFCNIASSMSAELWCDYIFLDTEERRKFAQVSHEYLIEQVQYNNGISHKGNTQTILRFNHPVKELIWRDRADSTSCCNATDGSGTVCSAVLQLNGHDRFQRRTGDYFKTVQRYEHHSGARIPQDEPTPVATILTFSGLNFRTEGVTVNSVGPGFDAVFNVNNLADATYTVAFTNSGAGFLPGDTISISGTSLSGTSPANDLIITLNNKDYSLIAGPGVTYIPNVEAGKTATFNVSGDALATLVTISGAGVDYLVGDTITISGSAISSLYGTSANDATLKVTGVNASGHIEAVTTQSALPIEVSHNVSGGTTGVSYSNKDGSGAIVVLTYEGAGGDAATVTFNASGLNYSVGDIISVSGQPVHGATLGPVAVTTLELTVASVGPSGEIITTTPTGNNELPVISEVPAAAGGVVYTNINGSGAAVDVTFNWDAPSVAAQLVASSDVNVIINYSTTASGQNYLVGDTFTQMSGATYRLVREYLGVQRLDIADSGFMTTDINGIDSSGGITGLQDASGVSTYLANPQASPAFSGDWGVLARAATNVSFTPDPILTAGTGLPVGAACIFNYRADGGFEILINEVIRSGGGTVVGDKYTYTRASIGNPTLYNMDSAAAQNLDGWDQVEVEVMDLNFTYAWNAFAGVVEGLLLRFLDTGAGPTVIWATTTLVADNLFLRSCGPPWPAPQVDEHGGRIDRDDGAGGGEEVVWTQVTSHSIVHPSMPNTTYTPQLGSGAAFTITEREHNYEVITTVSGSNYRVGETILVPGDMLYGSVGTHDALINILSVDTSGHILTTSIDGSGELLPIVVPPFTKAQQALVDLGEYDYTPQLGSGAEFKIIEGTPASGYSVVTTASGSNYIVGETFTISGTTLGGANTTNDATITITEIGVGNSISGAAVSGSGGVFPIIANNLSESSYQQEQVKTTSRTQNRLHSITFTDASSQSAVINTTDYRIGDKFNISGSKIGGSDGTNDLTLEVTSVSGSSNVSSTAYVSIALAIGRPTYGFNINGTNWTPSIAAAFSPIVTIPQAITFANKARVDAGDIYMYSFALRPEEHQPSGTCNFSRIDNAVLHLDFIDQNATNKLDIYAINYNVLRIMSGMGGLAYSN